MRKAKCVVQEGKESVNSTDGIPDKIGFPQKTLFDRPTRLDVLCAKKGLFAAISKPADTLFEPYSGSPAMPHEAAEPYEMQYAPIVAAIRKQAGKPARKTIQEPLPMALQPGRQEENLFGLMQHEHRRKQP